MSADYPNHLALDSVVHEYRIDAVLGAGSFGITYKATDTQLGMLVAIKEFFPEEYARRATEGTVQIKSSKYAEIYQGELDRFIGEGQVLAAFKHPNIVRVWRYFAANRTAYIVMEYEEGESLKNYLKRSGKPLAETDLRRLFQPVLQGLQEVHSKRYLHRDIKPANIYIRTDGTPLLLDFGAARLEMAKICEGGTSKLTLGYAPIEQYCVETAQGPALDLYALGATMYRCISGQTPIESIKRQTARQASTPDPLVRATQLGQGRYSRNLLEAIDWMLSLEPQDRPHSAREVLDYLQRGPQIDTLPRIHWQRPSVRNYTVLVAGPSHHDNITAIASLSDSPSMQQDTPGAHPQPRDNTKQMSGGVIKLSDSEAVHLHALPGDQSPALPEELLQQALLGILLLLDPNSPEPLKDLDHLLHVSENLSIPCKIAIGLLSTDPSSSPEIEKYYRHLSIRSHPWRITPPIFHVDPSSSRDMAMLMQALLYSVDPGLEVQTLAGSDSTKMPATMAPALSAAHRS
ncbi:MAG: serine/threonine protein kinase [Gammaproteobacteria bacterium]